MSASESKAVFLSYASQDAGTAKRIAEALRGTGVEVWFDQSELRGGDAWDAKIRKQIKECALFVPIISANTQARREGYFRREWNLACHRLLDMTPGTPFLLPVVIDGTRDSGALVPEEFRAVQWTGLTLSRSNGLRDADALARFCERVQSLLARELEPPPPQVAAGARLRTAAMPRKVQPRGVFIAATALVVAGAIGFFALKQPGTTAAINGATKTESALTPATAMPTRPLHEKSIAVLPFVNLSDDKDGNAFFAEGIHEDVLTSLSNLRELRVTSRTSAVQYRDTKKSIRQIGEELHVAYLLEGSVRRTGTRVRITGKLIKADTDEQRWARSYDRDLTDIFAVQAELAQAIAAELRAAISPEERSALERPPTENLAAYDLYLKARALRNQSRMGPGSLDEWQGLIDRALQLDPKFLSARTMRASLESLRAMADRTPEQLARARQAVEAAKQLAPDAPETLIAVAEYYYRTLDDYPRAIEELERHERVRPNDAHAVGLLASVQRAQGNWTASLASWRRAVDLDPGNLRHLFDIVQVLAAGRRFEEAYAFQQRLLDRNPTSQAEGFALAWLAYLRSGDTRQMEAFFARSPDVSARGLRLLWAMRSGDLVAALRMDGEREGAEEAQPLQVKIEMALVLVASGNQKSARERLGDAVAQQRTFIESNSGSELAWLYLAYMEAVTGHAAEALRAAQRAASLAESSRATDKLAAAAALAFVYAWSGREEEAISRYAELLRTPYGSVRLASPGSTGVAALTSIHAMKRDPLYTPLRGNPRWEALLNDPKNNAPLF